MINKSRLKDFSKPKISEIYKQMIADFEYIIKKYNIPKNKQLIAKIQIKLYENGNHTKKLNDYMRRKKICI